MSFPVLCLLSLFLLFSLPSHSLPLVSPSILGQPFVGGNFNLGGPVTPVVIQTPPLTHGAPTPPSPGGPTELASESSPGDGTTLSESGPAVVRINQDEAGTTTSTSFTPLMMAYYPAWVDNIFPPERINFSRFDWIDFAFAIPNDSFALDWDGSDSAPDILTRLVAVAHQQGKKVKLSIGGWGGSKLFSPTLESDFGRKAFVDNILIAYDQYHLDGIDIDWEYPGQPGDPRNYVDANDTANFLEFLKLLRTTLPPTARISAAVQTAPFADANGYPMSDVRAFADVLDWVVIMNYDTWGASSNPGPNAPLDDACRNSTQRVASAAAAINAWTGAGFPPSQIALGVPSYGYISLSRATQLRQRDQNAPVRALTSEGTDSGQVQFRDLVRQGALCSDPMWPGGYYGCRGFTRAWDECSSTPYLRSEAEGQVIAYDDVQSLGLKSEYARQRGLLGVNIFDLHGDTDQWELVDSLRRGLGL